MGKIPTWAVAVWENERFAVMQKEVEQFDGTHKTFTWVRGYDVVKALCIEGQTIILENDVQPTVHKPCTLPGWVVDRGEDPYGAICREIQEELGMQFATVEQFLQIQAVQYGSIEMYRYYYIAHGDITYGDRGLDAGWEHITLSRYTFDEFVELVENNALSDTHLSDWILRRYLYPGKREELRSFLFDGRAQVLRD